jgi:hypothetical protein
MARTASEIGKSNVRRSKTHERRVAKLLKEWSGEEFRRRRVEGRDESVLARESTADVIPTEKIFRFSVEAKCGRTFSYDALLASPETAIFTSWWLQASYDATLLAKYLKRPILPMLFFKPGINFDWVAFPAEAFEFLKYKLDATLPCLLYYKYNDLMIKGDISHSKKNPVMIKMRLKPVALCRWKDFADYVDPTNLFFQGVEQCHAAPAASESH